MTFWNENLDIAGPWAIGPERDYARPLLAQTPAGPISLPWPVDDFNAVQPQLGGLITPWEAEQFFDDGGVPTYGVETYAPYCGNLALWVIGTAVVMLVLLGNKRGS